MLRALCRPVSLPISVEHADALDEDHVLAALDLLDELDSQLRDAVHGHRGAGWRAARLAERLFAAIDRLASAATTGRTRARTEGGRRGER